MPETRYIIEHNGDEVTKIPYEVGDEELYQEQLARDFNDKHTAAIAALKHFDTLTRVQKDVLLKNLLLWALYKDGWLKLGVL